MHQLSCYSIFNVKLLIKVKIPSPFFLQNWDNFGGLPELRKKENIFDCVRNYSIFLFEKWISSNSYLKFNFYMNKTNLDEFKYQDSS